MPINAKQKGARLERKARDELEAQGYAVTRAGGSLGVWDLIAISGQGVLLIQVKANRRPGTAEMARMIDFPIPLCATRELWIWKDRKGWTKSEI